MCLESGSAVSTMYCITLCLLFSLQLMYLEQLLNYLLYNPVFSVQADVSGIWISCLNYVLYSLDK